MEWVNTIVQGILLGGLYAMFATGLSLMFGIMRLVNIAHGDFIILASYLGLVVVNNFRFFTINESAVGHTIDVCNWLRAATLPFK